ncbi:DNA sulfur modification protein DndB [Longispora sp. NPDC051575]|uniref:DNA sulfur modification protein DndB n=1 Tax=Longispora sp. NPDC051575 TaxID=3154943 RepID=UPI00343156FC
MQEHPTLAAAQAAAHDEASATGARIFPGIVFRQGERTVISTSFPMTFIAKHIRFDSATKGGNPKDATNRPLMTDHARSIRDYVLANSSYYMLPPVTLSAGELLSVHAPVSKAPTRTGFMVIQDETRFSITDGQHRIAALVGQIGGRGQSGGAVEINEDLRTDGLAVMIVFENVRERIHQDFADAAQTKPIPASLLAAYNMREPINRVLSRFVAETPLFCGRIDQTSKTLPKMSQSVFLLNQVRAMVKELLFGDYAMSEDTLAPKAAQLLGREQQQDVFVSRATELVQILTEHMEPWKSIVALPETGETNPIPEFRQQYINMTATGLNVIGRIGFVAKDLPDEERHLLYRKLATEVDWRREAAIWQNKIISGGKIQTQRGPVTAAVLAVRTTIGI